MANNNFLNKYQGVDYGTAAGLGIQDLLKGLASLVSQGGRTLMNASPVGMAATSLGAISGTPIGENPMGNVNEAIKKSLSPYQQGVEKGLKKRGEVDAIGGLDSGVPPQHIEQEAGLAIPQLNPVQLQNSPYQQPQGQAQDLNSLMIPGTPKQTNQASPQINSQDILKSLAQFLYQPGSNNPETGQINMPSMFGGFIKPSAGDQVNLTNAALGQQELTGQKPLQKGRREEIGLETDREITKAGIELAKGERSRMDKFFENINQPLSSAKDLSLVESALTGIDDINRLLGISSDQNGNVSIANEKLLRDMNWLSKNRQQLERARNLYINKTLRRDSGAAIGKNEEKDFKNIVGFDIGMKAFMQNPKVIGKAILESRDQLMRDRNRLSPNEKQRFLVTGLRDRGFKDVDIYDYLKRTGEVS